MGSRWLILEVERGTMMYYRTQSWEFWRL